MSKVLNAVSVLEKITVTAEDLKVSTVRAV